MPLLLKDCGFDGCKGTIKHCSECHRATAHFARPDGEAICGRCGALSDHGVRQGALPQALMARAVGGAPLPVAASAH